MWTSLLVFCLQRITLCMRLLAHVSWQLLGLKCEVNYSFSVVLPPAGLHHLFY
jgi:hypothetical protein